MRDRLRSAATLLSLAILLCAPAGTLQGKEKQNKPYALLVGSVFTAEGLALSGVPVSIKRKDDRKPKWRAVSDSRGEFAVRLPAEAATYEVTTLSPDHENQTKICIVVGRENESLNVIFRLERKGGERRAQP